MEIPDASLDLMYVFGFRILLLWRELLSPIPAPHSGGPFLLHLSADMVLPGFDMAPRGPYSAVVTIIENDLGKVHDPITIYLVDLTFQVEEEAINAYLLLD